MLRVCTSCGVEKDLSEFYKNKTYKLGYVSSCKVCIKETTREHYKNNKNQHTSYWLMKAYKITISEYNDILLEQGGVCAICHKACSSGRRLAVDHNHATGTIRGLLCTKCNNGIGALQESALVLKSAISYIEKHSN